MNIRCATQLVRNHKTCRTSATIGILQRVYRIPTEKTVRILNIVGNVSFNRCAALEPPHCVFVSKDNIAPTDIPTSRYKSSGQEQKNMFIITAKAQDATINPESRPGTIWFVHMWTFQNVQSLFADSKPSFQHLKWFDKLYYENGADIRAVEDPFIVGSI